MIYRNWVFLQEVTHRKKEKEKDEKMKTTWLDLAYPKHEYNHASKEKNET